MYFVKTPTLLKAFYSKRVWDKRCKEKALYLTFDDGPHPEITNFVLDELKKYSALATFFCIGKNVVLYPETYNSILTQNHTIANHTHNHLNGYKSKDNEYINNIIEAQKVIDSNLFRPPYGRCTSFQAKIIQNQLNMKIIMWDVLSGDFDTNISPQQCSNNVILNATNGSIIVFHDSEKAFSNLKVSLPATLKYFSNKGFTFKPL